MTPEDITVFGLCTKLTEKPNGTITETRLANMVRERRQFTFSSTKGDFVKPNPFSFTKSNRVGLTGKLEYWQSDPSGKWTKDIYEGTIGNNITIDGNSFTVLGPYSHVDYTALRNRCVSRLYDKIRNTDLNLLVSAAEAGEIKKLKSQALDATKRLVGAARKARGLPGGLARAWLTGTYGLAPILSDIFGLAEYSRSVLTRPITVKAYASQVLDNVDRRSIKSGDPTRLTVFTKERAKVKMGVTYQVTDAHLFGMSRLGLLNPASLVYELIPFSFVLDWIYNIGGYLQNLEASFGAGLSFQYGYETTTKRLNSRMEFDQQWLNTTYPYNWRLFYPSGLRGTADLSQCNRSVLKSFPKPNLPTVDLDLASRQLLSAAALLQSIFFRK